MIYFTIMRDNGLYLRNGSGGYGSHHWIETLENAWFTQSESLAKLINRVNQYGTVIKVTFEPTKIEKLQ